MTCEDRSPSAVERPSNQLRGPGELILDGLFALDGGEVVQELIQRITSLEVVEERADWYPGTNEDRCPTENCRITVILKYARPHTMLRV